MTDLADLSRARRRHADDVRGDGDNGGREYSAASPTQSTRRLVRRTCRDCERACKPQAAKHPECKTCMDDAAECGKACVADKAPDGKSPLNRTSTTAKPVYTVPRTPRTR